jgi:hypothetical protein
MSGPGLGGLGGLGTYQSPPGGSGAATTTAAWTPTGQEVLDPSIRDMAVPGAGVEAGTQTPATSAQTIKAGANRGAQDPGLTRTVDLIQFYSWLSSLKQERPGGRFMIGQPSWAGGAASLSPVASDISRIAGVDLTQPVGGITGPGGQTMKQGLGEADLVKLKNATLTQIGQHLGIPIPTTATPQDLASIPLPQPVVAHLQAQGYKVATGATLGQMQGILGATTTAGSTSMPGAPGTQTTTTIPGTPATGGTATTYNDQYTAQVNAFITGTDPNGQLTASEYRTQVRSELVNAGILSNTQAQDQNLVINALKQVTTQAAAAGVSLDDQLNSMALGNETKRTGEIGSFVNAISDEYGVHLTDAEVQQIAQKYAGESLTTYSPAGDQVKGDILGILQADPSRLNLNEGIAADMYQQIQVAAGNYLIPMSDSGLRSMVINGLSAATAETISGAATTTADAAKLHFREMAKGLFPEFATMLDQGLDTRTLVDPYAQLASSVLGVPASSIDFEIGQGHDSKWSALLSTTDPKTGAPMVRTLDQAKQLMMSDPKYGFQNSQGGRDLASSFVSALGAMFGKTTGAGEFNYSNTRGVDERAAG